VGYLIAGHAGAAAATAGIFLPAFVGVALTAPYVATLRGSRRWSSALDGVNAASLALMASVVLVMARHIAPDPVALAILGGASAVLMFARIGSGWVLLAGASVGLLRALL
jgi:chromate transporter